MCASFLGFIIQSMLLQRYMLQIREMEQTAFDKQYYKSQTRTRRKRTRSEEEMAKFQIINRQQKTIIHCRDLAIARANGTKLEAILIRLTETHYLMYYYISHILLFSSDTYCYNLLSRSHYDCITYKLHYVLIYPLQLIGLPESLWKFDKRWCVLYDPALLCF